MTHPIYMVNRLIYMINQLSSTKISLSMINLMSINHFGYCSCSKLEAVRPCESFLRSFESAFVPIV